MAGVPKCNLVPIHRRYLLNDYPEHYVIKRGRVWSVDHFYQSKATAERKRDYNNIQAEKRYANEKRMAKCRNETVISKARWIIRWIVVPTVNGWALCYYSGALTKQILGKGTGAR